MEGALNLCASWVIELTDMISIRRCVFLILILFLAPVTLFAQGQISGRITEASSGAPLIGANVVITGTSIGAAADENGAFKIQNVPEGLHTLEASMLGFETDQIEIAVVQGEISRATFALKEATVSLREMVVTPGRFTVMQAEPTAAQTLSREEIQSLPQLGEDVYRAVSRLPGLSSNDYSSAFNIRGGQNREVLVQLDGLELYEPFHIKDIGGGALSILDVEAIGGIDMMTGAFPVEYGDRMSGVFNIDSHTPALDRSRTSFGLSFTNLRFLSEGRYADGKGEWLILARRGYLDIILGFLEDGDGFSPTYYDVYGKTKYRLNNKHTLGFNVLQAGDNLTLNEDDGFSVKTKYGSTYAWMNWNAIWSHQLLSETVASAGRLTWDRDGSDVFINYNVADFRVDDKRDFNYIGLKQDWTYDLSQNHLLKAGIEFKTLDASYTYTNLFSTDARVLDDELIVDYDSTRVLLDPSGSEFGVYASHRFRPVKPLTIEWGLRYDAVSWADDANLSPRVNVALALSKKTALRLGWGHFYQSQGINEINVQDGEDRFYPAERAEHRVVGIEHAFGASTTIRLEAYQKELTGLRPRFINLLPDNTDFFPEIYDDRARFNLASGEAKGIELLIRQTASPKLDWTASYSYSVVEDQVEMSNGSILSIPRAYDQRHTVYLDASYRPSSKWRMHFSWQYRTGWPYTDLLFEKVDQPDGSFTITSSFGEINASQYPAYHRMDIRVSRYFDLKRSRLAAFLEVSNLYNRSNPRVYYYDLNIDAAQQLQVMRGQDDWLPRLPSIGISWDLYR